MQVPFINHGAKFRLVINFNHQICDFLFQILPIYDVGF